MSKLSKNITVELNQGIKGKTIFLVSDDGHVECSKEEGLSHAENAGLDLIKVGEKDGIPVCRIMDYNKYLYNQKKKTKTQKPSITKEIKINYGIGQNDLHIKLKKVEELLQTGHAVKLLISYRGREVMFIDGAKDRLQKYIEQLRVPFAINGKGIEVSENKAFVVLQPTKK